MPISTGSSRPAYLCVDEFLSSLVEARALKTAFELRIIDRLLEKTGATAELYAGGDRRGFSFLLDMLVANGVLERDGASYRLSGRFHTALTFRDLLEAKLDFANLVAPDVLDHFTSLIADPVGFQKRSRLFELFGYQHCFDPTPENVERTRAWMRFTTCLTRYEAQALLAHHDFSDCRRLLDIGGNSGEFSLQLCRANPNLHTTVFDLPVVCKVGREHVAKEPEASRITFQEGSALTDPLPAGCDCVTFKSMLHDWPDVEAKRFLTRASQALAPGGTILIFERAPIDPAQTKLTYAMIPMLLFFRSFRNPAFYERHLEAIGLTDVRRTLIELEMPFFVVTARLGESLT